MVVVAFMWGISMPIFFPLCAVGLWILYVTDRLRMAYYYKQPPLYSSRMTILVNKVLIYSAPFFMLIFGFWNFTNQRIFNNKSTSINNTFDFPAIERMNPF